MGPPRGPGRTERSRRGAVSQWRDPGTRLWVFRQLQIPLARAVPGVKILTEKGLQDNGEIAIVHSKAFRLKKFTGRTVLPDGTIEPVPADAKFTRTESESKGIFVTAVAFPGVQVGAILDCSYELESLYTPFLEPWYFSDAALPVRHAELVYRTAKDWRLQLYSRSPLGVVIDHEESQDLSGRELRVWAENLPALPHEPHGPPFGELAAQALVLPAEVNTDSEQPTPVLKSWFFAVKLIAGRYWETRQRSYGVARKARSIAAKGTPRQTAEALFAFVRDEIQTTPASGLEIDVDDGSSLGKVLSDRRGTATEKTLLLAKMLSLSGIHCGLIWARDRRLGAVTDTGAPNPAWFDAATGREAARDRPRGLRIFALPVQCSGEERPAESPTRPVGEPLSNRPLGYERGFRWWSRRESNPRPLECHSSALPTELRPHRGRECIHGGGCCQTGRRAVRSPPGAWPRLTTAGVLARLADRVVTHIQSAAWSWEWPSSWRREEVVSWLRITRTGRRTWGQVVKP
jgi:Domain of Unknown Function with PDB structure (DUF3857)